MDHEHGEITGTLLGHVIPGKYYWKWMWKDEYTSFFGLDEITSISLSVSASLVSPWHTHHLYTLLSTPSLHPLMIIPPHRLGVPLFRYFPDPPRSMDTVLTHRGDRGEDNDRSNLGRRLVHRRTWSFCSSISWTYHCLGDERGSTAGIGAWW